MHQYPYWKQWSFFDSVVSFTGLSPGNYPQTGDHRIAKVNHASVIMIRGFMNGANNDLGKCRLVGWAQQPGGGKTSSGPGEVLCVFDSVCGDLQYTEPILETQDRGNPWGVGKTWREADTWTIDHNACEAYHERGGQNSTSHLIVHTMEYPFLMLECDLSGGSNPPSEIGFIWREMAAIG